MAQQSIGIGAIANDGTGDTYREAFDKTNQNFTELYGRNLDSVIIVKEPVQLSGALDSTKQYLLDGVIDFTGTGFSIEVPAGGLQIAGFSFDVSKLICSDAGYTLFNSPVGGSGNLLGDNYAVEITGTSSKVYDLMADTGLEAFEFSKINYNNCTSLGEIDGYRQGLETGTGRFGGAPNLTLSGTWSGGFVIMTSIVRALDAGMTGALFQEGTGFSMESRFRTDFNIDLPVSAAFLDFQASNFPNASTLQLAGCIISRSGVFDSTDTNITPNILASEVEAKFDGNIGIPNTFEGGRATITTEVASVISGIGTFTALLGTYTVSDLQHFDTPVNGQLRHLGDNPREYKLTAELTLDSTAGNELEVRVRKFDSSTTTTSTVFSAVREVNSFIGGRDVAFFTMINNVELDSGDFVFLEVTNNTATNNVTAELDSQFFLERRA